MVLDPNHLLKATWCVALQLQHLPQDALGMSPDPHQGLGDHVHGRRDVCRMSPVKLAAFAVGVYATARFNALLHQNLVQNKQQ
jgi:hypothetical protein